jgi:predicted dehydrogenase
MSIKFGLVGVGNIAEFHAKAIQEVEGAELVVCNARTRESGEKFAREFNCDYIQSYEEFLARDDIDAVAITTPSGTHAALGVLAAKAGKHVLCEKPIDISVERIDELIAACEEAGVLLGAIFQARFGEGAQALKKAIDSGRFGKLTQCSAYIPWFRSKEYYASAGWRGTWALDGGGALMNQGIHAIDLLLWLAGEVAEVSAKVQTRLHDIEVEDNAAAWLQFQNGALGAIQGSTACYPGESRRVEIKGEKGSVTLVDDVPVFWEFEEAAPQDEDVKKLRESASIGGGASDPKAIGIAGHCAQYADFVQAIQENRQPAIPGKEGRRAVELIRAIYDSSAQQEIISL